MSELPRFSPPWLLKNGFLMTVYVALRAGRNWESTIALPVPDYRDHVFQGAKGTSIFGQMAQPQGAMRGTVVGTYGITGSLDNQWFLQILGRKAIARGYGVVLFDWRGHGQTAQLSPELTSDGIYEGEDFVRIAAQAQAMGYPGPFWFVGYSLGGQLALWGVKTAQERGADLGLNPADFGGGAVVCPSIESNRSLDILQQSRRGRIVERAIVKQLRIMVENLAAAHPGSLDPDAIARVKTIRGFDHELVIQTLGFATTEDYYAATSPIYFLPELARPTYMLYAADDPLFAPELAAELATLAQANPAINLTLTQYGGHVGYVASKQCQHQWADPDRWWAWNRLLDWLDQQRPTADPGTAAIPATASTPL
jgi:uncharacterized protein